MVQPLTRLDFLLWVEYCSNMMYYVLLAQLAPSLSTQSPALYTCWIKGFFLQTKLQLHNTHTLIAGQNIAPEMQRWHGPAVYIHWICYWLPGPHTTLQQCLWILWHAQQKDSNPNPGGGEAHPRNTWLAAGMPLLCAPLGNARLTPKVPLLTATHLRALLQMLMPVSGPALILSTVKGYACAHHPTSHLPYSASCYIEWTKRTALFTSQPRAPDVKKKKNLLIN